MGERGSGEVGVRVAGWGWGDYAGARLGQPIGLVPCWAERPRGGGVLLRKFFLLCFVLVLLFLIFLFCFLLVPLLF